MDERCHLRTSLRDLGEGQTGASLEVYVVGEDQGAERSEGLAREEVGLASVLEVLKQVGDGLAFGLLEERLLDAGVNHLPW